MDKLTVDECITLVQEFQRIGWWPNHKDFDGFWGRMPDKISVEDGFRMLQAYVLDEERVGGDEEHGHIYLDDILLKIIDHEMVGYWFSRAGKWYA